MTKRNTRGQIAGITFWRDDALPFIEARSVQDGRKVCYAPHAHETFSIGTITGGRSGYVNGSVQLPVTAGSVVVMNPEDVHCCNPVDNEPWSYLMLYVDADWLASVQQELSPARGSNFQRFATILTTDKDLYGGLNQLYSILADSREDQLRKHSALITFFSSVQTSLNSGPIKLKEPGHRVVVAAEYIRENCTRSLKLEEICAASGLSAPYLIRAFKSCYNMTPHAYLINSRIEYCRTQLKRGESIAEVALNAGFSDQAHLQRAFKQHMAVTPGQYRSPSWKSVT